jgi:cell division protein YceG involved in septum cleavage
LEGFLYPDTYKVDIEKNIIDQLVYLQLETFKKRVWDKSKEINPQV